MERTPARILERIDQYIVSIMQERYGWSEMKALRAFLSSETYGLLLDKELGAWHHSPYIIFDFWENEYKTGDYTNSLYIRGDEL